MDDVISRREYSRLRFYREFRLFRVLSRSQYSCLLSCTYSVCVNVTVYSVHINADWSMIYRVCNPRAYNMFAKLVDRIQNGITFQHWREFSRLTGYADVGGCVAGPFADLIASTLTADTKKICNWQPLMLLYFYTFTIKLPTHPRDQIL